MTTAIPARPSAQESPAKTSGQATVIVAGSCFTGKITGEADVVVEGRLDGQVELDARFTVGAQGTVVGDVVARSVRVAGRLQGNVQATERVELAATGSIEGDVVAPRVVIAEGGFCRGKIEMNARPQDAQGQRSLIVSESEASTASG